MSHSQQGRGPEWLEALQMSAQFWGDRADGLRQDLEHMEDGPEKQRLEEAAAEAWAKSQERWARIEEIKARMEEVSGDE